MKRPTIPTLLLAALLAAGTASADDTEATGPRVTAPELHLEPYVFEAADGTRVDAELGSFKVPENRLQRIAEEARRTLLADAINFPHPGICKAWGVPDLGDDYRSPVRSEVPALFISGTLDGRTPPSNAEEILPGFANGVHLVIEGAGHSNPLFLSSPKIAETMLAFLRGEPVKDQRIVLPPVELVAPRETVEVAQSVLERYVGSYRINEREVREVLLEGGQLFTRRTGGRKRPITPQSKTGFYYPGSATHLRFVSDESGRLQHMVMYQNGQENVAKRVE